MTTTELRKKITEANEPNWFKSVEVTIQNPNIEFEITIKGVSSIHKFLTQQINGWEKYETIPTVLNVSKQRYSVLKKRLEDFTNRYYTQTEAQLNQYWNTEKSQLQQNGNYFTYDSSYTIFLIDLNSKLPNATTGAYNYIIKTNNNLNDRNAFIGSLLAYEFDLKDKAEITERRKKEKTSFSKIKNDFQKQLSDSQTELTEHLSNANSEFKDYTKKLDDTKSEKEVLFNNWFEGSEEETGVKKEFTDFKEGKEILFDEWFNGNGTEENIGAKNKIADLENIYEEQLRLKKPAEYWKIRAVTLKEEGWKAMKWLIVLVVFACITLYLLLWLTPEGMLLSFIEGNAQAIKWSIIYVTFISFLAYGIRALHKVAFSSFHLARDSEEREQLTYFYLALIKDKAVDEKDRNLILQSLFSRADTGLLKDDSGPTMPNDMAGKFFGK